MSFRLLGEVRAITGTGGSIGRASAPAFAHDGALVDLFPRDEGPAAHGG